MDAQCMSPRVRNLVIIADFDPTVQAALAHMERMKK